MELWKIVFLSLILPPMSYQKQRGNTFTTIEQITYLLELKLGSQVTLVPRD